MSTLSQSHRFKIVNIVVDFGCQIIPLKQKIWVGGSKKLPPLIFSSLRPSWEWVKISQVVSAWGNTSIGKKKFLSGIARMRGGEDPTRIKNGLLVIYTTQFPFSKDLRILKSWGFQNPKFYTILKSSDIVMCFGTPWNLENTKSIQKPSCYCTFCH